MTENLITFSIFCIIYLSITLVFKLIDHISDKIVSKTFKNKKGVSPHNGKSPLLSLLGITSFKDMSPEFFDEEVIRWGVSRDFLLFKDLIGQSNKIEKRKLDNWESVLNGEKLEN